MSCALLLMSELLAVTIWSLVSYFFCVRTNFWRLASYLSSSIAHFPSLSSYFVLLRVLSSFFVSINISEFFSVWVYKSHLFFFLRNKSCSVNPLDSMMISRMYSFPMDCKTSNQYATVQLGSDLFETYLLISRKIAIRWLDQNHTGHVRQREAWATVTNANRRSHSSSRLRRPLLH